MERDHIIRMLANWMDRRLTGKRAEREEVINFLAQLSPEERSGIWKLRTFYQRYNRGRSQRPTVTLTRGAFNREGLNPRHGGGRGPDPILS